MILAFDKIPVVRYGTPSTDEIHEGLKNHIFAADVFLLGNHGVVSVGQDVFSAFYKIEAVESIAKTLIMARLVGGEAPLSHEKMTQLYQMRKAKQGKG